MISDSTAREIAAVLLARMDCEFALSLVRRLQEVKGNASFTDSMSRVLAYIELDHLANERSKKENK